MLSPFLKALTHSLVSFAEQILLLLFSLVMLDLAIAFFPHYAACSFLCRSCDGGFVHFLSVMNQLWNRCCSFALAEG